jgi:DNA-binding NtrC family response regulator
VCTPEKLLVVDTEVSVRESLASWLREEGYEVETSENASDVVTRLEEGAWDATLVDIRVYCEAKLQPALHDHNSVPILILLTEIASVETAVGALTNGAYGYVTKPLRRDEVAHVMRNALAHRRTAQENVRLQHMIAEGSRPAELAGGCGKSLGDIERAHILRIVEECGGNQSHAADVLGIDRVTLYHKLKKYGWTRNSIDRSKKNDVVAR